MWGLGGLSLKSKVALSFWFALLPFFLSFPLINSYFKKKQKKQKKQNKST
jgi:hypothetical protein